MESNNCSKSAQRYIRINGEKISVSEQVYQAICSQNNHDRWIMKRERRCAQTVYTLCDGDCPHCSCHTAGIFTSLDAYQSDKMDVFASDMDVEAEYIRQETWNTIYDYADQVTENGARILKLHFVQGFTIREISAALGIPKSTVHMRMEIVLKHLQVRKKELF